MLMSDKQIWWEAPNAVRIPLGIALAIAWYLRMRRIYIGIKTTPQRSPQVRRIEVTIATVLWTFILIAATVLLTFHR